MPCVGLNCRPSRRLRRAVRVSAIRSGGILRSGRSAPRNSRTSPPSAKQEASSRPVSSAVSLWSLSGLCLLPPAFGPPEGRRSCNPDGQVIGGTRPHHAAANDDYIRRTLHRCSSFLARRQPNSFRLKHPIDRHHPHALTQARAHEGRHYIRGAKRVKGRVDCVPTSLPWRWSAP